MTDAEFQSHLRTLAVPATVSAAELERAWMRASFAATQAGDPARKAAARAAYAALRPRVQAREQAAVRGAQTGAAADRPTPAETPRMDHARPPDGEPESSRWDPRSPDSPWINALAVPLVVALAWLANHSPLAFLLGGFKIWIHEFGHATVAWMSGYKALPLPFGWTNIEPEKQGFVYGGGLFLIVVFGLAGWRERRPAPLLLAPALAAGQWWMTWRVPEWRTEQWIDFAGVGGEFYLSALMVAAFYFDLPEKFRWGTCRYLFLFIGAAGFLDTYGLWHDIAHGVEQLPWGTMLNGGDDVGGDLNKLHQGWGWTRERIVGNYTQLGRACIWGVGLVYAFYNLRLHRLAEWGWGRWNAGGGAE